MSALRFISRGAEVTADLGRALGAGLQPDDVLRIDGPLGAGKTHLVRGIAAGLGLHTRAVSSPTFVLVTEYTRPAPEADRTPVRLVHADAYRLRSEEDAEGLDLESLARGAVLAVEWGERIAPLLDRLAARWPGARPAAITLAHAGEDVRTIELDLPSAWWDRAALLPLRRMVEQSPCADRGPTICPITGQHVPADAPTWPFASERARLADLGRWMSGAYRISRPLEPDDEHAAAGDEPPPPTP